MIKQILYDIGSRFQKRTDTQKAYLWLVTFFLVYYFIYLLVKKTFTLLYVIPLICFIKGFTYWLSPSQRKIRPTLKKILFVMFTLWIILLGVEFYLKILQAFGKI